MRLEIQPWITKLRILLFLLILTDLRTLRAFQLARVENYDESFLDDTSIFPHAVDVKIMHNDKQILLEMEQNPYLDVGQPIIALREGAEGERVYINSDKTFQPYQDAENGAAITLSCITSRKSCTPLLEGSYFHGGALYHIEPVPHHMRLRRGTPGGASRHHVYRRTHPNTDRKDLNPEPVTIQIRPGRRKKRRLRRQEAPTYIVEILLVLDYEIYRRFYESVPENTRSRDEVNSKLKQYYFQVFNGMDMRYRNIPATDYTIRIRLSNFIVAEEKRFSPWTETYVRNGTIDVTEVLKQFAETKEEIQRKYNLTPFDHAMAMSGYDLIFENKKTTLGYAYLNTTCQYWSVSFVEDRNDIMKTIWTAAHELGHSMCALHDGYQNACQSHRKYIMTSTIDKPSQLTSQNPWQFSTCSIQYFREMLEKLNRQPQNCLLTTSPPNFFGEPEWEQHLSSHFGTLYNPDEQCQRIHGNGSYMCRHKLPDASRICTNLWCHRIDPDTGESECTPHLAAPGTTCGNKKWCQRGQCVFNQAAPPVADCPYGDQPGVLALGKTCPDTVHRNHDMCRLPEFNLQCCKSCRNNATVSLRINRGAVDRPVVDNYIVPQARFIQPAVPPSQSVRLGTRSSIGSVGLPPSTSTPRRNVVYQAPPVLQHQPDPQLPPVTLPTQRPRSAPGPRRGSCQDIGSPFNQSIVGCRGFHTFCYLARVKRDCCATCRRSQISPVRVIFPADQTRKKRASRSPILLRLRRKRQRFNWKVLQAVKRSVAPSRSAPLPDMTRTMPNLGSQTPDASRHPQSNGGMEFPVYTHTSSDRAKGSSSGTLADGRPRNRAKDCPSKSAPQSPNGPFQEMHENGSVIGALPPQSDGSVTAKRLTSTDLDPTRSSTRKSTVPGYVSNIQTETLPTTLRPQTDYQVRPTNDVTDINVGLFTDPLHEPPAAI